MQIERYELFVQSIYRADYEHAEKLKETIIPLFKKFEQDNYIGEDAYYSPNSYTSYYNTPDIFQVFSDELEDLKNWISSCVNEIHRANHLPNAVKLTNSWFSINRKHAVHDEHNHIPHVWSGVYYIQSDFDKDAKITFLNPNDSRWPYADLKEYNNETSLEKTMHSSTGSIWIFPGYMNHKVSQQLVDNERISIAFNFDYANKVWV